MFDTLAEADRVQMEAMRRRTPIQRLRDALQLSEELRAVALQALRRGSPGASTAALVERLTGESCGSQIRTGSRLDP